MQSAQNRRATCVCVTLLRAIMRSEKQRIATSTFKNTFRTISPARSANGGPRLARSVPSAEFCRRPSRDNERGKRTANIYGCGVQLVDIENTTLIGPPDSRPKIFRKHKMHAHQHELKVKRQEMISHGSPRPRSPTPSNLNVVQIAVIGLAKFFPFKRPPFGA